MIPIEKVKEKICKDCVCVRVCTKEEYQTPCKKYIAAKQMHEWTKQQIIEKACDVYCKDCEYIGCDKFECLALEKFKKAMEEEL